MIIFLYANGGLQKCTASREGSKFIGAEKGGAGRLSCAAVMGKVYKFASKVMSVKNTAIAFIKKHPKSIITAIGITTLLVGVSVANPALMSTGIATVVSAIIYIPPPMTSEQGDIAASIKINATSQHDASLSYSRLRYVSSPWPDVSSFHGVMALKMFLACPQ